MDPEDIDRANIENLTNLWKAMGGRDLAVETAVPVQVCDTWPHRCWTEWDAGDAAVLALRRTLGLLPPDGIVPVWGKPAARAVAMEGLLIANGFAYRSAQTAMCLEREKVDTKGLKLSGAVEVEEGDEAGISAWTQVGSKAFGYAIDEDVVRRIAADPDTTLLLLEHDGRPAATGLIYRSDGVAGLHQLGVPPDFRGKGLARALMHDMLVRGLDMPVALFTLQASEAGRRLYDQLGFVEQFTIQNFLRRN